MFTTPRRLRRAAAVAALLLALVAPATCWRSRPPPERLTTAQQAQEFAENESMSLLAFVPEKNSAALQAVTKLAAVAGKAHGVKTAWTPDRSLLPINQSCGNDCDSPVAVLTKRRDGDGRRSVYSGAFSAPLLIKWAGSHATPLVSRYSDDAGQDLMQEFHRVWATPLPQVLVALEAPGDLTPAAVAFIEEAAAANDDLKFFVTTMQDGQHLLQEVDVPLDSPAPLFLVQYPANGTSHLRAGMRLDQLPEFVYEYKEGALAQADEEALRQQEAAPQGAGPDAHAEL